MAEEKVKVKYELDESDYIRGQENIQKETKQTSDKVEKESNKQTLSFKNMTTKVIAGFGGLALAIGAVVRTMNKLTNAYKTQEKAVKGVEQVLKTTGRYSKEVSEDLQDMASSFQEITNYGDEEILANSTKILLTFANIGVDSMQRVQAAVLDMSATFGQDLKSSAIQLGKALDEPITGLTALRRVGVSFSESEKEMIKQMTEANDIAAAQDVILTALEKQIKGQAQTQVDAATQGKNSWGDFLEVLGERSKPIIDGLWKGLTRVSQSLSKTFKVNNKSTSQQIADLIGEIENLQSETEPTAEDTERLQEAMNQISIISPNLVQGYDDQGNAIVNLETATKGLLELKRAELEVDRLKIEEMSEASREEINNVDEEIRKIKERAKIRKENALLNRAWAIEQNGIDAVNAVESTEAFLKRMKEYDAEANAKIRAKNDTIALVRAEQQLRDQQLKRIEDTQRKLSETNVVDIAGTTKDDNPTDKKKEDFEKEKTIDQEILDWKEQTAAEDVALTRATNEEKYRLQEEMQQKKMEQEAADREFIRANMEYRQELKDREAEIRRQELLKEYENSAEAKVIRFNEMADKKTAASFSIGLDEAKLKATQDLVNGEMKSLGDYVKVISDKVKAEQIAIGISAGTNAVFEFAKGLAAKAVGSPTAADHFGAAADFAKTAALAGAGAVAAGGISSGLGGGDSEGDTTTTTEEENIVETAQEEIETQETVFISEQDYQRMRFGLVDEINDALEEGKALKVARS